MHSSNFGLFRPTIAWLTVNRTCNFRCQWCIVRNANFDASNEMSFESATKFTNIAKKFGINNFVLIGGEPTLWQPLFAFNEFCQKENISTCLATNGSMFGDDDFWVKYSKSPCNSIYLSIKSIHKDQFADFTGNGHLYDITTKGIRRILRYHDDVGVEAVLSNVIDAASIVDIAAFAKKSGGRFFTLDLCSDISNSQKFAMSKKFLVKTVTSVYKQLNAMFGDGLTLQLFSPLCWWPTDFLKVAHSKGQLVTKCHVSDRSGIVFDTNGDILMCSGAAQNRLAVHDEDYTDASSLKKHLELLTVNSNPCRSQNQFTFCADCMGGCYVNQSIAL